MSDLPDGWSVEVDGSTVVVRVPPAGADGVHLLDHVDARIVGRRLYAASRDACGLRDIDGDFR
jgi:hypothetical protein